MDIVFIGLTLSSSWANGHATTYRTLTRGLGERGHRVTFLENDTEYYAAHRDLPAPDYVRLELYQGLEDLRRRFAERVRCADAVIVGSYVHDGAAVIDWVLSEARGICCFYDIDTPVTLAALTQGERRYLRREQIPSFDMYLSFTGGPMLEKLKRDYGARQAAALYCAADTDSYAPQGGEREWALGYLGTYSPDRQPALEELMLAPARARSDLAFVVAGSRYPDSICWPANTRRIEHVPPGDHPSFYSRQAFTLNLTRSEMVSNGWSPSIRLFEAAACGAPIISDRWPGLDSIFPEGEAILIADRRDDVRRFLEMDDAERNRIADNALQIVRLGHSGFVRAGELERYLEMAGAGTTQQLEAAS